MKNVLKSRTGIIALIIIVIFCVLLVAGYVIWDTYGRPKPPPTSSPLAPQNLLTPNQPPQPGTDPQTGTTPQPGTTPPGTGGTTESNVTNEGTGAPVYCSNSKYSTWWDGEYVALTHGQELVLNNEIDARGNAALEDLKGLDCLEKLVITWESSLTNLTAIKDLTSMRWFAINTVDVSSIAPLAGMTKMEILQLGSTKVTNISVVANMKNLRIIDLSYSPVTDVSPLYNLPYIQEINLHATQISTMPPIENFKYLTAISVGRTPNLALADDETEVNKCYAYHDQYRHIQIGCI